MAFSLLQVGERLSLDFETSNLETFWSHLRQHHPDMRTKMSGIYTVVTLGGERFLFGNEWDDPCLISETSEGDELLRAIHRSLP